MPPFSKAPPGCASEFRLFRVNWNHFKACSNHKKIELTAGGITLPAFDDQTRFE